MPVLTYFSILLLSPVFEVLLVGKTHMITRLLQVVCDATFLEFLLVQHLGTVFRRILVEVLVAMKAVSRDPYWDWWGVIKHCYQALVPLRCEVVLLSVED